MHKILTKLANFPGRGILDDRPLSPHRGPESLFRLRPGSACSNVRVVFGKAVSTLPATCAGASFQKFVIHRGTFPGPNLGSQGAATKHMIPVSLFVWTS